MATKFTKGQCVIGTGRNARTRYLVKCRHRDGTVTVRAMFHLDEDGQDRPGYLGYLYRVPASDIAPMPVVTAA